jgi:hypothetical protein
MYQNHQSRKHNKNGLQPCSKTIDQDDTIKMDYSHVPKPLIKRTQKKWITAMYQNHRSREHNKNGLQPYTKTIDPENTIKMDYSHVPKPSFKRTQ